MSVLTVRPGDLIILDPSDKRVIQFDWDAENLADSVTITSVFTITVERQVGAAALTKDNPSVLAGNRKTQVRLDATTGARGEEGTLANTVTTNESPAQVKEQSVRYLIQDR